MKKTSAYLITFALLAITMAVGVAATVELTWNPAPVSAQVTSYIVWQSETVTGIFVPVRWTTSTNVVLSMTPGACFFYVTALPNNPAPKVAGLRISLPAAH